MRPRIHSVSPTRPGRPRRSRSGASNRSLSPRSRDHRSNVGGAYRTGRRVPAPPRRPNRWFRPNCMSETWRSVIDCVGASGGIDGLFVFAEIRPLLIRVATSLPRRVSSQKPKSNSTIESGAPPGGRVGDRTDDQHVAPGAVNGTMQRLQARLGGGREACRGTIAVWREGPWAG